MHFHFVSGVTVRVECSSSMEVDTTGADDVRNFHMPVQRVTYQLPVQYIWLSNRFERDATIGSHSYQEDQRR